jgi:hypothetical protein
MAARVWKTELGLAIGGLLVGLALWGCAYVPNQFREDGPSVTMRWDTPAATDIKEHYAPAALRERGWARVTVATESGGVAHLPLYFEDPFEDKGHGRTDETDPHNVYRGGWEDYVAVPYGFGRFTANWLLLPVSAIVTTPWTIMESDGKLSRQLLGYDHDAVHTPHHVFEPAPRVEVETTAFPAPAAEPADQSG